MIPNKFVARSPVCGQRVPITSDIFVGELSPVEGRVSKLSSVAIVWGIWGVFVSRGRVGALALLGGTVLCSNLISNLISYVDSGVTASGG